MIISLWDYIQKGTLMNALECIKTRRSIRSFQEKPVEHETIESIVEAASFSPSWKNTQIARYIVVEDKELKDKIAQNCTHTYKGNEAIISGAAALVVVSYVKNRSGFERDGSFSTSKGNGWEMFDAGVASQTFCLAAHSFGLGTVIMGLFDDTIAEAIDLPENQDISCIIALGYPAVSPEAPKRKSVSDLLTFK